MLLQEPELIARCQSGDVEAFGMLVEMYSDKAVRTAYLITGRVDIAEDITQEAFIQAIIPFNKKNAQFFKTRFYKILMRTSWKVAARTKEPIQVDSIEREANHNLADCFDVIDTIATKQGYEALYKAVSALSKHLNEVVVLHYYNDFSIKEIAQVLNCREGTIRSRLFKARKLLTQEIMKNGWDVSYFEDRRFRKEGHSHV